MLRFVFLPTLLISAFQAAAQRDSVLEDSRGKLGLEARLPKADLIRTVSGTKVTCEGCQAENRSGAPDMPVFRFMVISGSETPRISIRILESELLSVPGGIAP